MTQILKPLGPSYLGTIALDELDKLDIPKEGRFGFVMNLSKRNEEGTHWVAFFGDARPEGSQSLEYYDSFADPPPKILMDYLPTIVKQMQPQSGYVKFKENKIIDQDSSSSNCGFFAAKFLIDRFRGKKFKEITRYDDHLKGEKEIEEWKKKHKIEPFKYLSGDGIFDIFNNVGKRLKAFITGKRDDWPPNVRNWIKDHGTEEILKITVVRQPISGILNQAINLLSLGKWDEAKKQYGYRDMFHLFLLIEFSNEDAKLERNHVVQMYKNDRKTYPAENSMVVPLKPITLEKLLGNVKEKVGPSVFKYDAADNNCQIFVRDVLKSSGLLTTDLEDFIMQDAKKHYSKTKPWG